MEKMKTHRGALVLVMFLGALATFPRGLRVGFFDINDYLGFPITGALLCGFSALLGYGLGNKSGKAGLWSKAFGLIAALLIFLFTAYLSVLPI